jgi:hypothetical protein
MCALLSVGVVVEKGPPACGGLSEFDKQLFFMTALIACERAPIGA